MSVMTMGKPGADATDSRPLMGQTALVTGAASGIGAGVARVLAAAGAAVAVNYVTGSDAAEAIVADIRTAGGTAMAVRADVSREDEVQAMFRTTLEAWDGLDILVSNAGIQKDAAITEMTLAQWNAVIGVNLTGTFLCAREAARAMIRQGIRPDVSRAAGKIICISSVHEVIPWAGHVNYAASKGGMKLFMQSLAQELAPYRIRVNSVAPGAIQTPINRPAWETPEALASLLTLIPYGRIGQPEDIGKTVAWIASDDADYIHGQTILVDGGMTLYPEFARGG
jgi:glucose 1-dehydrogenase